MASINNLALGLSERQGRRLGAPPLDPEWKIEAKVTVHML